MQPTIISECPMSKVDAASHFAEATGKAAAIGALKDLAAILRGEAGTTITAAASGIEWAKG
jgi:carbamate kinase